MNWLKRIPLAHRGLYDNVNVPENSISAFKNAVEKGYGIELDVRLTKDKQVVVFHDSNLLRLSKSNKNIKDILYKDLNDFKLFNTNEKIPLLKDVLKIINGKVPLLIEIKNYEDSGYFEEKVYELIKDYKGVFGICSFNPNVILYFRKNYPEIKRGLIYGNFNKSEKKYINFIFLYRYIKIKPNFISVDFYLLNTFISKMCNFLNLPLVAWTIDTKEKEKKAFSFVDNIIFEYIKPEKRT